MIHDDPKRGTNGTASLDECKSLEELYNEAGCGKPIDFTPLLNHNLRQLGYHDWRLGIEFRAKGSPKEIQESIQKYQRTTFLEKQKE